MKKKWKIPIAVLAAAVLLGIFGFWLAGVCSDAGKWRHRVEVQEAKKQIFDEIADAYVRGDIEKLEAHYSPEEGEQKPNLRAYAGLKLADPEYRYGWLASREDLNGADILVRYELLEPVPPELENIVIPVENSGKTYCFQHIWACYEGRTGPDGPEWVYSVIAWDDAAWRTPFIGPGDGYRAP